MTVGRCWMERLKVALVVALVLLNNQINLISDKNYEIAGLLYP